MCVVLSGDVGRGLLIEDNRPVFISEVEPLSVESGDKAVFRVQARGNPLPSFHWCVTFRKAGKKRADSSLLF